MAEADDLTVEICFAQPGLEILRGLSIKAGATLQDALIQSRLQEELPELDLATCPVGIYGKHKSWDTLVRDRDRIEIYRPLIADPKESRRRRAQKKQPGE